MFLLCILASTAMHRPSIYSYIDLGADTAAYGVNNITGMLTAPTVVGTATVSGTTYGAFWYNGATTPTTTTGTEFFVSVNDGNTAVGCSTGSDPCYCDVTTNTLTTFTLHGVG